MGPSSGDCDALGLLVDEFLARRRRGETPTIPEYAERYPELADQIHELFPALEVMEEVDPDTIDLNAADTHGDTQSPRPERLGDYRILREIGRGAMGVVYEAEQQSLGRHVAIKVLPTSVSTNKRAATRFRREARAAARLHHTNIVPVFEVGQDQETAFYAMQYIQGHSLDEVLIELRIYRERGRSHGAVEPVNAEARTAALSLCHDRFSPAPESADIESREQPSPEDSPSDITDAGDLSSVTSDRDGYIHSIARIGEQVASALSYAHTRGIVHRDIKPSNLLLDEAGVVWVADFGLAKFEEDGHSRPGDIVGTLRYMSPERFRGRCDARADVYSLGATLYEMLVLRPAYGHTDQLALIDQISNLDPPRPRSVDATIPRDLETIVLKAMDKVPDRRYESADALADDLRRFLDDEPIRARHISLAERFLRWTRRNKAVAALSTAVSLLLIATALVSSVAAFESNLRGQEAEHAAAAATKRTEEMRCLLYIADMNVAQQAWDNGNTRRVEEILARHVPTPGEVDLRRFEWYYLRRLCERMTPAKTMDSVGWRVAFLGSGDLAATHSAGVRLFDGITYEQKTTYAIPNVVAYSRDGRTFVSRSGDKTELVVHHVDSSSERKLAGNSTPLEAAAVSPDGSAVVGRTENGILLLWDVATGELKDSCTIPDSFEHPRRISSEVTITFSPRGGYVASGGEDNVITLWDLNTGERTALRGHFSMPSSFNGILAIAFSPDGTLLASGAEDRTVRVWNVKCFASVGH